MAAGNIEQNGNKLITLVEKHGFTLIFSVAMAAFLLWQNYTLFNNQQEMTNKVLEVVSSNTTVMKELESSVDENSQAIRALQRSVGPTTHSQ